MWKFSQSLCQWMSVLFALIVPCQVLAHHCKDLGGDMHVNFPASLSLRSHPKMGSLITPFTSAEGVMHWECELKSGERISALLNNMASRQTQQKVQVNGKTYAVYPSNIAGVGIIMQLTVALEGDAVSRNEQEWVITRKRQILGRIVNAHDDQPMVVRIMIKQLSLALVHLSHSKLPAQTLNDDVLEQIGLTVEGQTNGNHSAFTLFHRVHMRGSRFVASTCTVPDVTVTMPPLRLSTSQKHLAMQGEWYPFTIPIADCPAGMGRLHYRFGPPKTGLLDIKQQVMRGANDGLLAAAKGIGIQLALDNEQIVQFGQDYTAYPPAYLIQQGGVYVMPFKARYVKPVGHVAHSGRVFAPVSFELDYE
jgi:type 1 fimbria pilin